MLKWEQVYMPERAVSDETIKRYKSSLAQLGKWLTDKYIHEIDEHLIDAIVEERMKHVTTATLKRDLGALASVLSYARQLNVLTLLFSPTKKTLRVSLKGLPAISLPSLLRP
jgi:site-specific recombinase XerD